MCVCGCVSPSIRSQRLFKSCASARWRTAAAGIPVELQQGGVTMPLSEAAFLHYQMRLNSARRDRDTRVQAYTVAGVKCCLAGLGEGCNRLTFPACFEVRAALAASTWVREATEAERAKGTRWWRPLEFVPGPLCTLMVPWRLMTSPWDSKEPQSGCLRRREKKR